LASEILGWGHSGKGSVGSMMVVEVLMAIEDWVELFDA
jgi:hypothetical protein